jgi:fibronectin type 3 domain-containing protein
VTATLNGVQGTASVTVTAVSVPPAPTNLTATPKGKRIALSWTGSSGVTYRVYRGTASGTETFYASGLTGTTYTDSVVVSGRTYYYRVTAVSAGGESPPSNEASAKAR